MEKLFEKRIGAYFQVNKIRTIPNIKGDIWASWPMSRLTMYKDKMAIDVLWQGQFVLPYNQITNIEKIFLGIQIHHTIGSIKPFVMIQGIGNSSLLYKKIIKVIKDNDLNIETL
ncbi:MAG: hypothetical protein WCP89_01660 [archaeon]